MHLAPKHYFTLDDYFEKEAASVDKHEFYEGLILAMAGGTFAHNRVATRVTLALGSRLRGTSCQPLGSDMRVATPGGLYTYPDVVVVCGPPQLGRNDTLLNPTILIEVLSPSTRGYDRGDKLALYQAIPSLVEILFFEVDEPVAEQVVREVDGWALRRHAGLDAVMRLTGAPAEIPLAAVFGD